MPSFFNLSSLNELHFPKPALYMKFDWREAKVALQATVIFTIVILLILEQGIFIHLFVSSLISFISVLYFSICRSFVCLGRFIPKLFILFVEMLSGIFSIISFFVFSLLVYRNARDF